jgi:hypothetical protein
MCRKQIQPTTRLILFYFFAAYRLGLVWN